MTHGRSPMLAAWAPVAVAAGLCARAAAMQVMDSAAVQAVPAEKSPCDGCEFTVNLRCEGVRSSRSAPFHRIQDCLLPLYGLMDLARNASVREGKRVCAITWLDIWEGLNLSPFLVNLTGVRWHSIINEREACTNQMPHHSIIRTKWTMASQEYLDSFGSDPYMIKSYPVDVARNLQVLQADVRRLAGDEQLPSIVVLQRRTGTRRFRPVALQEMISRLGPVGLPVVQYRGKETAVETIRMFSSAKGVLGYHGAAWANVYFSTEASVCNVQVSTFYDLESTKPWRTSKESGVSSPSAIWYYYLLPLNMLLDANHVNYDAYLARQEKDHFIKDMEWVPLRDIDIEELAGHMVQCLMDPVEYAKANPDHDTKFWTRGWEAGQFEKTQFSGRLASTGRDECSGCDVTVDLRCEGMRDSRGTYYSTLAHCLLPAYEMLQVAREAGSNSSAQVCAVIWDNGYSLRPFLESVADVRWHKILNGDDACVGGLKYHAVNRSMEQGGAQRLSDQAIQNQESRILQKYAIDSVQNLNWMQKDVANLAGRPSPHIVVLQKRDAHTFPEQTLDLLTGKLAKFMRQPVTVFTGEGSIVDVVKLFANMGSVVGFWGELWVNTLFTNTPHCAVEFSTYEDIEKTKRWRTSAEIKELNPTGDWYFLHLPVTKLLEGNGISSQQFKAADDKDSLLLNMKLATVPDEDAVDVASRIYLCWQSKERAYSYAVESWSWHGHA